MRKTLLAQTSIFEEYSKHKVGIQLKKLSSVLDDHPEILRVIKKDLVNQSLAPVGRRWLTVESVFRCLLLKQQLGISYEQLAFHLSDSMSYRTFVRLPGHLMRQSRVYNQQYEASNLRRLRGFTLFCLWIGLRKEYCHWKNCTVIARLSRSILRLPVIVSY